MLGDLGPRLVYDQDGTPVIVAFAVSSFVPDSNDPFINSRMRETAKSNCIDLADGMIAEVVNGQMSAEKRLQTGEEIDRFIEKEVKPDAMAFEKNIKNIVKISKNRSQTRASMDLQGISSLMPPKAFKLPNGQQMFCTVRCWKYSTLRTVKAFNENNFDRPSPQTPKDKQPAAKPGSFDGRKFNTLEDF